MTLKVIIEVPHPVRQGSFKELYRTQLQVDDSVHYNYQALINGIKMLFPNKNLVISLILS